MTLGEVVESVGSTIWSKLGLWLGYLAVCMAIVLGVSAVWFYKQNTELHNTIGTINGTVDVQKNTIAQLKSNDAAQDKALSDMVAVRAKDAQVMNGLVTTISGISKDIHTTKSAVKQLKEHSDEAKAYLDTPLPASVRGVLSGSKASATGASGVPAQSDQSHSAGNAAPARASTVGSTNQH